MNAQAWITLGAVLVALFGRAFWDWRNKPKIKISLKNEEPHVVWNYSNNLITKLFRLKVINEGNTIAKNCLIKILSVSPAPREKPFEPDALKWSSAPKDTRYYSDSEPIYRETKDITPKGGWEFCDLFFCWSGDSRINFVSYGNRQFLAWNQEYNITIEISGDNLKPRRAEIKISNIHDIFVMKVDWVRNTFQPQSDYKPDTSEEVQHPEQSPSENEYSSSSSS